MDLRICFCSNFLSSILNSNKKDEKAMTVIDVSGCGSGAVFLIKGKANLLFEAGMAYAADQMVENIKRELGDAELDAVLLSHSHYDHVAGLPAVRKAWPGVKTYASERAKEILVKPGALKTIRRLSGEAAEAALCIQCGGGEKQHSDVGGRRDDRTGRPYDLRVCDDRPHEMFHVLPD